MLEDIDRFLDSGGRVNKIAAGQSQRLSKDGIPEAINHLFTEPRAPKRQYLTDVVKTLEARKQPNINSTNSVITKPKKVPIYDDFGEVIRFEWR